MSRSKARWVLVATFSQCQLAEMAANILKSHGIPVWPRLLPDGYNEGLAYSIGSEILVLECDIEDASDLLRHHFGQEVLCHTF